MAVEVKPRLYQLYLLEHAMRQNTLAFLPTGSGKTLISILLINHYLHLNRVLFESSGEKMMIVFIAPTKILVDQQRSYIAGSCSGEVRAYTGETIRSRSRWKEELAPVDVMVATPELLRHALEKHLLPVKTFSLFILDECHNAIGRNPMAVICELIRQSDARPRVLGLTASPLQCKRGLIAEKIAHLEWATNSKLVAPPASLMEELCKVNPLPTVTLLRYNESSLLAASAAEAVSTCSLNKSERYCLNLHNDKILKHAQLRLRHASYIHTIYKLGNTLKVQPNELIEFEALRLPDACNCAEGALVNELQSVISQTTKVAEECGLLCALYSFRECIHPAGIGSKFGVINALCRQEDDIYEEPDLFVPTLDDTLSDIDIDRFVNMTQEIVEGPFTSDVLTSFRDVGVASLLDTFASLVSSLEYSTLSSALDAMRIKYAVKTNAEKLASAELICSLLQSILAGEPFLICQGSLGALENLRRDSKEPPLASLPPIGRLCIALTHACNLIANLAEIPSIFNEHKTWCEEITADAIPQFQEHEVDTSLAHRLFINSPSYSSYSLISNKVKALISFLSSCTEKLTTKDWACVVFCQMRLTVQSLKFLLSKISRGGFKESDTVESGSCSRLLPDAIIGFSRQRDQVKTLIRFKAGKFNVLLATNVVEEGLDVRTCQLVINFNLPSTLKSLIQRRGRARANGSSMVILSPLSIEGNVIIRDLGELFRQEFELEQHVRESICSLMGDLEDFSHEGVIKEDEPAEEDVAVSGALKSNDFERCFVVESTGARVDVRSSVQLLIHYAQQLPHDGYYIPEPIFWFEREKDLFRCSVLLPISAPALHRCAISPFVASKALAKGLVSLACVRNLHSHGELDDWLLTSNKPGFRTQGKDAADSSEPEVTTKRQREAKRIALGEDSLMEVEMKGVPDEVFQVHKGEDTLKGSAPYGRMYLYSFEVQTADAVESAILNECNGCSRILQALGAFGLMLPTALTPELLSSRFNLSLRGYHGLSVRTQSLGYHDITDSEILHIQRFHKATLCWEESDITAAITMEDWVRPSNGLLYMIFPLYPVSILPYYVDPSTPFSPPNDWSAFLIREADAAQLMIGNMLRFKRSNMEEKTSAGDYVSPIVDEDILPTPKLRYRGDHTVAMLHEMLIATTPHNLYVGLPLQEREKCCCLTDSMDKDSANTKTFFDHYRDSNLLSHDDLQNLVARSRFKMARVLAVNGKLDTLPMLARLTNVKEEMARKPHHHSFISHLPPDYCVILGLARYYYIGIVAPSCVWRLLSLILAAEATAFVRNLSQKHFVPSSLSPPADSKAVYFHLTPSLSIMLDAITPRMCMESMDSERLEMLGDSFMKFIISVELFQKYPTAHEGGLTTRRNHIISNDNQMICAQRLGLGAYLRAVPMVNGLQVLNFEPPGRDACASNLWNGLAVIPEKKTKKRKLPRVSEAVLLRPQYHSIRVKPKLLADLVESIVGAFYVHGGVSAAMAVVKGLECWPADPNPSATTRSSAEASLSFTASLPCVIPEGYPPFLAKLATGFLSTDSAPAITNEAVSAPPCHVSLTVVNCFASILGYRFTNMLILEEATTHCSVPHKRSNQRLEFLGDAVLDIVVVSLIFHHNQSASQGDLSLSKSNATNNKTLGNKAMELGLHRYLHVMSSQLLSEFRDIELFFGLARHFENCKAEEKGSTVRSPQHLAPLSGRKRSRNGAFKKSKRFNSMKPTIPLPDPTADIEFTDSGCLKALADFLEALIGAVYLDSGGSLQAVESVVRSIKLLPQIP